MSHSPGDSPFLKKEAFHRLVELNQADVYEREFPIQQAYMLGNGGRPRLVSSEQIVVEFERQIRRIGKLSSSPASPQTIEHTQYGKMLASTVYQHYEDRIPPNHVVAFRDAGMPNGSTAITTQTAVRDATRRLERMADRLSDTCFRSLELQSARMLSSEDLTVNIKIDGQDRLLETRLDAPIDASAAWSATTTDIPGDLGNFWRAHVDRAGMDPTHIFFSFELVEDLAKNEKLREVGVNTGFQSPLSAITDLPIGVLPGPMRTATQVISKGFYQDELGATQRFWPRYTMTFASLQQPTNVLDMITCPTALDDYQGGLFSNVYRHPKTADLWTLVGINAAPLNLDTSKITLFNLDP